ncbi:exonuclease SbcCD subunit D [Arthrobacter sp. EH-1B-1]|uniref:Nuclease SbcCD subunit D n=1 Tax=Arthrobacter vasquezii TaxID=2977629 RepID=A0ABT6CVI0_9MICC|nr:exonuclease SbcCD subunit D [Arthrobacter vasquezii]MDF9278087.1 exonuclease SbcCD subunit D [Arthrobacter vasquezii]
MRLLHTSDWHLGRSFHGVGMLEAQRLFVDQLEKTVREENVDVVLIAGDVYDRALPGVDVVELFDEALERITVAGAQVVVSSGNHDSAVRLGFGGKLIERGGVHLRTRLEDIGRPAVFRIDEGIEVAVYGVPYLEPRMVADPLNCESSTHTAVTAAALDQIRSDLRRRRTQSIVHSVVMAHTFASGGVGSDSERELSMGGLGVVPLNLFEGFDYVALGHLHGQQQLQERVRYSGSPLAYSFSEARQSKGAWLVDIDEGGVGEIQPVKWAPQRELAILRGPIAELITAPEHAAAENAWCQVTLTDAERPHQAMERLRARFPGTLVLAFEPSRNAGEERTYSERIAQAADDASICCGFLEHVRQRSASTEEAALFAETIDALRAAESGA